MFLSYLPRYVLDFLCHFLALPFRFSERPYNEAWPDKPGISLADITNNFLECHRWEFFFDGTRPSKEVSENQSLPSFSLSPSGYARSEVSFSETTLKLERDIAGLTNQA
jgi:hypothetical protein